MQQTGFYEFIFESSFPSTGIQKTAHDIKADCYADLKAGRVSSPEGSRVCVGGLRVQLCLGFGALGFQGFGGAWRARRQGRLLRAPRGRTREQPRGFRGFGVQGFIQGSGRTRVLGWCAGC